MDLVTFLELAALGVGVGLFGTLIGAGGGFVLTPVLLLLYPTESPETITGISLAVVFFNATSGSIAYARMKRIDYKSGVLFALASVPGAIAGALTTPLIPRRSFDLLFGIVLVHGAALLIWCSLRAKEPPHEVEVATGVTVRIHKEASGHEHRWSYNRWAGIGISAVVGFLSSLLGIGGGIIHVPVMVYALNFPVHIASATSHFTLSVMSLAGTAVHVASGALSGGHGLRRTLALGLGVLIGAQIGARLSSRVKGEWIIRSLALALVAVGIRIFIMGALE